MTNYFHSYLEYAGTEKKDLKVLIIGAMDGVSFDQSRPYIDRYNWSGVYVEPIPEMYDRLIKSFEGKPQEKTNKYEMSAIHTKKETVKMLRIKVMVVDNGTLPLGYSGMSSVYPPKNGLSKDPEVMAKYGEIIEVPGITLSDLIKKHNITEIDFISIDTEGWDWKILRQLDISRFRPKLIHCEYENLSSTEKKELKSFLIKNGYKYSISNTGSDIDAISPEALKEIKHLINHDH